MAQDMDRDKFWQLYEKLPPDLKDMVFDDVVGERVDLVCSHNGISDDQDLILDKIGDVLLGILPPSNLLATISQEAVSAPEALKKAVNDLNLLFSPVRESLLKIYGAPAMTAIPVRAANMPMAAPTTSPGPQTTQPPVAPSRITAQPIMARPAVTKTATPTAATTRPKTMPSPPAANPTKPSGPPAMPRSAQPKTAQPQAQPADSPTLSAAPGGLRRKVF